MKTAEDFNREEEEKKKKKEEDEAKARNQVEKQPVVISCLVSNTCSSYLRMGNLFVLMEVVLRGHLQMKRTVRQLVTITQELQFSMT